MKKFQKNEKDIFTIFSAFFYKDFPIPPVSYIHPIHAGKAIAEFDLGIEGDDTGDNISSWNKNFSELTVAYYIWKNYDAQQLPYWGLCHYRRYFCKHLHWSTLKKEYHFTDREKAFKKIFTDKFIVDLDLRSSGLNTGKKSFMNLEINFYLQEEGLDIKGTEIKNSLQEITKQIFKTNFSKNEYFKFYLTKKSKIEEESLQTENV